MRIPAVMSCCMWRIIAASLGIAVAMSAFASGGIASTSPSSGQRVLQVDHLFELEDIGQYYGGAYAFSTDGQRFAFTRVRPKNTWKDKRDLFWGNDGGDIWVQLSPGSRPVNLTEGSKDGSSWWAPEWSPDGRYLAMLSTRGEPSGGSIGLWVWDSQANALQRLTTPGVALSEVHPRPYRWANASQLLLPTQSPRDRTPPVSPESHVQRVADGKEVTASVLDSGVPVDVLARPQGQLLLIDIVTGQSKVIAKQTVVGWQMSPTGNAVATARLVNVHTPRADEPLKWGASSATYSLQVARTDGTLIAGGELPALDIIVESLSWSPDGNQLAFLGYTGSRDQAPSLYRLKIDSREIDTMNIGALDAAILDTWPRVAPLHWSASGKLVVRAVERNADRTPRVDARRDWWLLRNDGSRINLTMELKTSPHEIWPEADRKSLVGLADGEIWRIDLERERLECLTGRIEAAVNGIVWPIRSNSGREQHPKPDETYRKIVFEAKHANGATLHLLNLDSGRIRSVSRPEDAAELVVYSPSTDIGIYLKSDKGGLRLWQTNFATGRSVKLIEANTFLPGIAEGEVRAIEYTSLDGEKLKGWLVMPVGYDKRKKYPLITHVYAGFVAGEKPPHHYLMTIGSTSAYNFQIPAAHGYAVLWPSMPLEPEGVAGDPMLHLLNGVLPAVEKVIEMGIADPERLFLMGQSFGGFSTYGLVTQTRRFRAAVSLAGLSNLVSLYGQFVASSRYSDYAHENMMQAAMMESGPIRMGNPPWRDLGRYLRNSPIFYVDRVQTPLMIVQGDMDYVAMQQGEEFFMSLYRQGKRAQFVRYWGEGHVLESPANIRDMWQRVFAWFDDFGDIARDAAGNLIFDGDRVRSRGEAPALKPEDFAEFDRKWANDTSRENGLE